MNLEELEKIAKEIVELEKLYWENKDKILEEKIAEKISKISFEDFLIIDDYIQKNKLLTK